VDVMMPPVTACLYKSYHVILLIHLALTDDICDLQVLAAIPDQDTFYDMLDALEDQGMEKVIQQMTKSRGARPELLSQFSQYETMLRQEDSAEPIRPDLIETNRYLLFECSRVVFCLRRYDAF
jgi:hypothetical protein